MPVPVVLEVFIEGGTVKPGRAWDRRKEGETSGQGARLGRFGSVRSPRKGGVGQGQGVSLG